MYAQCWIVFQTSLSRCSIAQKLDASCFSAENFSSRDVQTKADFGFYSGYMPRPLRTSYGGLMREVHWMDITSYDVSRQAPLFPDHASSQWSGSEWTSISAYITGTRE